MKYFLLGGALSVAMVSTVGDVPIQQVLLILNQRGLIMMIMIMIMIIMMIMIMIMIMMIMMINYSSIYACIMSTGTMPLKKCNT